MIDLRAPFPWNGGKRRVAHVVWQALGPDLVNYVEPFFGSGAVLLARPGGAGKIETINDLDGGVINFWRALTAVPDEVAHWCDWPVSELDLHARHAWLVERLAVMADELRADPEYFDAKVAGWWVWGICQWIGTGWCGEPNNHKRPILDGIGKGTHSSAGTRELPHQRPRVSGDSFGMGVLKEQLPELAIPARARTTGKGVLAQQMPFLNAAGGQVGMGVNSPTLADVERLPAIGNDRGINGVAAPPCSAWFRALQERLRRVRIVCGDWKRVLGPSVLGKGKNVGGRRPCGVFLDCPYDPSLRAKRIYNHDEAGLSGAVRDWAVANGDDPDLRIVVCGYEGEHEFPSNWRVHRWKGVRGYAGEDNDNREKETIWFSPHCLGVHAQASLFASEVSA